MPKFLSAVDVTIPASGTTTNEINLTGRTLYAIVMPATFTGTALTFTGAPASGGTFVPIYDQTGNAVSVSCGTSRIVSLVDEHVALRAVPFVKVVSGASEGSARTLTLLLADE